MTNQDLLSKLAASGTRVIVHYDIPGFDPDLTEPMDASVAAPMVATIEKHGGTCRIARAER